MVTDAGPAPSRVVFQADALAWMDATPASEDASVITSLPDVSELPLSFDAWRAWFVGAARRVLAWIPRDGVAIFYQSDIRHHGAWIDKGHLVHLAADDAGMPLLWHHVVCRKPPGTVALGRPSYSHMMCFARPGSAASMHPHGPDVLPDAGAMPWSRAMGVSACRAACTYLLRATRTRVVVDPFCGNGTALAVANAMGLDAIGVDLAAKRCKAARRCTLEGISAAASPRR